MVICKNEKCPAYNKCDEFYRGSGCAAMRSKYGIDADPTLEEKREMTEREIFLHHQTLSLLRKEIQSQFYDWKDADDWLFAQLDFTKEELKKIFPDEMIYTGSALD